MELKGWYKYPESFLIGESDFRNWSSVESKCHKIDIGADQLHYYGGILSNLFQTVANIYLIKRINKLLHAIKSTSTRSWNI